MTSYRIVQNGDKFFVDRLKKWWFCRKVTWWSRITVTEIEEVCGHVHESICNRVFSSREDAYKYIMSLSKHKDKVIETINL